MSEDYKQDILLDKHNLDQNAIDQARLGLDWGEQWALAVRDRDQAKRKLEVTEEQCDKEIREFPHRYGWTSTTKEPTETFIKAKIPTHPDFVKASEEMIEAEYQVNLLSIIKTAFTQRASMLRVLADLYGGGYFSSRTLEKVTNVAAQLGNQAQNDHLAKSDRFIKRSLEET